MQTRDRAVGRREKGGFETRYINWKKFHGFPTVMRDKRRVL